MHACPSHQLFSPHAWLAFGVLALLPLKGYPGDQTGPVQDIRVASISNYHASHVMINGTYNSPPACATVGWWAFDAETSIGKAMLATLLTAKTAGKSAIVWGAGTCELNSGMETIRQVSIQP